MEVTPFIQAEPEEEKKVEAEVKKPAKKKKGKKGGGTVVADGPSSNLRSRMRAFQA